jgi:hypothetical protein
MTVYDESQFETTTRPDRRAWIASKTAGDAAEQLAASVFRSLGLLVDQQRGLAPHDLTISGGLEIKNDRRAAATGNIAVETAYNGRPSGITTSTASGWAFLVGPELLLMPTRPLRELVNRGCYRRVAAGEGATVALVPIADIRTIARCVRIGGGAR